MRKISASIILFLFVSAFLFGCSQPITSGEVIDKTFTPEHTETRVITTFIYSGKVMMPITTPYIFHYNDRWEIKIRDYSEEEGKYLYATYSVTEEAYNQIQIGDQFVYSEELENKKPEYTREEAESGDGGEQDGMD